MDSYRKARVQIFSAFFFACVAFGCQSSNVEYEVERNFSSVSLEWEVLDKNPCVQFSQYRERNLLIHCVKIDLSNPRTKIQMIPKDGQNESEFVKKFARKNNLAVAFNTTPFWAQGVFKNKAQVPAGICVNDGRQESRPLSAYCALGFFKDEDGFVAKIFSSQSDSDLEGAQYAAGGFWQILKDGKIIPFEKIRDSRTVCAVGDGGRTLFVMAVEGEKKNSSAGLTYMECARFLLALGFENAMEFDGGASTQLSLNGRSVLTYKNKIRVPAIIGFSY